MHLGPHGNPSREARFTFTLQIAIVTQLTLFGSTHSKTAAPFAAVTAEPQHAPAADPTQPECMTRAAFIARHQGGFVRYRGHRTLGVQTVDGARVLPLPDNSQKNGRLLRRRIQGNTFVQGRRRRPVSGSAIYGRPLAPLRASSALHVRPPWIRHGVEEWENSFLPLWTPSARTAVPGGGS